MVEVPTEIAYSKLIPTLHPFGDVLVSSAKINALSTLLLLASAAFLEDTALDSSLEAFMKRDTQNIQLNSPL